MKNFKEYLLEQQMNVPQALETLGLADTFDANQLKKAYRSASLKAHPDKGGSHEQMQRINAAYALLKDKNISSSKITDDWMEAAKQTAANYLSMIDEKNFRNYLSDLFGVSLSVKDSGIKKQRYNAYRRIEFASNDRETVISIRFAFQYVSFYSSQAKLSAGEDGDLIPASVITNYEILHNRQKMKISSSTIDLTRDLSILTDPSRMFPKERVRKKIDLSAPVQTSSTARKVKKRDFITTLENKFVEGEMIRGDVYQISFPGNIRLQGTRHTMRRQGYWQFMLFERGRPTGDSLPMVPETDKGLDTILQIIRVLQDASDKRSEWKHIVEYWKSGNRAEEWYPE